VERCSFHPLCHLELYQSSAGTAQSPADIKWDKCNNVLGNYGEKLFYFIVTNGPIWNKEELPEEWKESIIVPIH
jgi:hypothetical protein